MAVLGNRGAPLRPGGSSAYTRRAAGPLKPNEVRTLRSAEAAVFFLRLRHLQGPVWHASRPRPEHTLELRADLFAQHDQQHARGFGRMDGMRHVRGHQHQGLRCRHHSATADGQRERSRQGEDERIKGRGVL
jgi:hypothetical protein